jgi:hypothetical protein
MIWEGHSAEKEAGFCLLPGTNVDKTEEWKKQQIF